MNIAAARRLAFGRAHGLVLRDVSITVGSRERIAIVGDNGAGKSTLLRLLVGLERPARGVVQVAPAGCGYVPQAAQGSLFPWFSVLKNVAMPRLVAGCADAEEIALECLRHVAASLPPKRRAAALSGGERQAVALARALAAPGPAVFADEPFSALAPELRDSARRAVDAALGERALVLVTHEREDAVALGARLVRLEHGVLSEGAA